MKLLLTLNLAKIPWAEVTLWKRHFELHGKPCTESLINSESNLLVLLSFMFCFLYKHGDSIGLSFKKKIKNQNAVSLP